MPEGRVVLREAFTLVGVKARTSNAEIERDAPALWGEAMRGDLHSRVPGSSPGVVVAAYADYAGDHTAPFTMWVGVRTTAGARAPEGLEALDVPGGSFGEIEASDESPAAIEAAWGYVWNAWPERERRSYVVDYEIHTNAADAPSAVVLFVGVK